MSKFNELVKIYQSDRKFFRQYEQTGLQFVEQFTQALAKYYRVPPENFVLLSKDEAKQPAKSVAEALLMDQQGFWHIRYGFNLPHGTEGQQSFLLVFEVLFKKLDGRFILRLPDEEEFFVEANGKKVDFSTFLNYLHDFLKRFLENRFERFLNGESTERKAVIGFRVHDRDDDD
ncbi:MAG: hypothetical protein MUD08_02220 [Cytophagales bacterium]|jgi:hypothetical protein|nr:hypothetical protein [Cytophagales bacterium]